MKKRNAEDKRKIDSDHYMFSCSNMPERPSRAMTPMTGVTTGS